MTYRVEITITNSDRPTFELRGEGDVENLKFSFAPEAEISFRWAPTPESGLKKYATGGFIPGSVYRTGGV